MEKNFKNLLLDFQREPEGLISVSLSRPDVRNALSSELISELTQFFKHIADSSHHLRLIVLKGEGSSFCAGADLKMMQSFLSSSKEQNEQEAGRLFEMFESIWFCPVPILTVAHGSTFGGGLGLLACSDFVFARSGAQFCFSEVKLGLAPAVISTFVLKRMRIESARDLMFRAAVFGELDALSAGLVDAHGDDKDLQEFVESLLADLKNAGSEAVRETKLLLQNQLLPDLQMAKRLTIQAIAKLRVSEQGQEGIQSFFEKRKPNWRLK